MELKSFKCPWCDHLNDDLAYSLSAHARNCHGKTSKELYDALFGAVKCGCGCGQEPRFASVGRGYSTFVRGHQARVNNNWGHNTKAQEKSQDTRREMHKKGMIRIWNRGESKETNSLVRESATKCSQTVLSSHTKREKRSKMMRENRLNGTIPTLRGPAHSQWKGGVSSLQNICRSYINRTWVFPKLKEADFMCQRCSAKGNEIELNVHHSGERFADIVRNYAQEMNWTGDESDVDTKIRIAESVSDHHVFNDVPGIVVCHDCHVKIHEELGERIN